MLTILRPLGALPIIGTIALKIVGWMVIGRLSAYEAAKQAALEYDIFQQFTEEQISALSHQLSRETPYAEWQWFSILRWAQEYGLIRPVPRVLPDPWRRDERRTPLWMWAVVAGVGVLALLYAR